VPSRSSSRAAPSLAGHLVDRAPLRPPDDAVTIVESHGLVCCDTRVAGSIDRRWVPLRDISPTLVNAVIAAEDSEFRLPVASTFERSHALPYSTWSVAHAQRRIDHHAALVKSVYGRLGFSPWAKSLEALRAIALERMLSKTRYLEQYLNRVPSAMRSKGSGARSQEYLAALRPR